jgi:hypothetical protein
VADVIRDVERCQPCPRGGVKKTWIGCKKNPIQRNQ